MKTLLFILFLIPLQSFSQVNPWENKSTQNPWGEKEILITEKLDSTIVSEEIEISQTAKSDSIIVLPKAPIDSKVTTAGNKLTKSDLDIIKYRSRKEYQATGTLFSSVLTSVVFSVFALPVNLAVTGVTTKNEQLFVAEYKDQHPKASAEEIKYVKRGAKSKKIRSAVGGSILGAFAQMIIIITAFN